MQVTGTDKIKHTGAANIADALKYSNGVLVQDYGGVGGLKTVNVRSLGTGFTGIFYDELPVLNAQTGQTDLGRFAAGFTEQITVSNAHAMTAPIAATAVASGSTIHIQTKLPEANTHHLSAFIKAGSNGIFHPGLRVGAAGRKMKGSVQAQWMQAHGRYRFKSYESTGYDERKNSAVKNLQAEANLGYIFNDSNYLRIKAEANNGVRQLPGAIILYGTPGNDSLKEEQYALQFYQRIRTAGSKWTHSLRAKYSNAFTEYMDPDFLNAYRRLHNTYEFCLLYTSPSPRG